MRVTTDVGDFVDGLRVGDVLAFDSLANVSALIQWADGAPVNHVGLVVAPTELVMANRADSADDPTVQRLRIKRVVGMSKVRTVVALRHRRLRSAAARAALVTRVAYYERHQGEFAVADLLKLAPAAVRRSYLEVPGRPPVRDLKIQAMAWAVDVVAAMTLPSIPADARTLHCSEFVYRCFVEAGIDIDVLAPFAAVDGAAAAPGRSPGLPADAQTPADRSEAHARSALPDPQPCGEHRGVRPDWVTPGDLYRSRSFTAASMLAKPPLRDFPPA